VFSYLGGLMILAVAGFIGVWQAPGVVNDWLVASDPVAVPDATITDGGCRARRVVFVECSAHIAYEIKGETLEHDIELMFVDFNIGDYEVDVVRSASQQDRAALSLGLDMLWTARSWIVRSCWGSRQGGSLSSRGASRAIAVAG
jgi:hypothetical protein